MIPGLEAPVVIGDGRGNVYNCLVFHDVERIAEDDCVFMRIMPSAEQMLTSPSFPPIVTAYAGGWELVRADLHAYIREMFEIDGVTMVVVFGNQIVFNPNDTEIPIELLDRVRMHILETWNIVQVDSEEYDGILSDAEEEWPDELVEV